MRNSSPESAVGRKVGKRNGLVVVGRSGVREEEREAR